MIGPANSMSAVESGCVYTQIFSICIIHLKGHMNYYIVSLLL